MNILFITSNEDAHTDRFCKTFSKLSHKFSSLTYKSSEQLFYDIENQKQYNIDQVFCLIAANSSILITGPIDAVSILFCGTRVLILLYLGH